MLLRKNHLGNLPQGPNGPRFILTCSQGAFFFSGGVTEHQLKGHYRQWVLVRLEDGRVSSEYAETREDALRIVHNEHYFMAYQIPYDRFPPNVAEVVLAYRRDLWDNGYREDRHDKKTPILPRSAR
jgi:hypothetical protein